MIPATIPHIAVYADDEELPVVAWDDEGVALISSGCPDGDLVRARNRQGFIGVKPAAPVVGVLPGAGHAAMLDYGRGHPEYLPVLCWLVDATGAVSSRVIIEGLPADPAHERNFFGFRATT